MEGKELQCEECELLVSQDDNFSRQEAWVDGNQCGGTS